MALLRSAPDGFCLLHSVLTGVLFDHGYHLSVEQLASKAMEQVQAHKREYNVFHTGDVMQDLYSFFMTRNYLNSVVDILPKVIADALQLTIVVWQEGQNGRLQRIRIEPNGESQCSGEVNVLFHHRHLHYEAIVKRPDVVLGMQLASKQKTSFYDSIQNFLTRRPSVPAVKVEKTEQEPSNSAEVITVDSSSESSIVITKRRNRKKVKKAKKQSPLKPAFVVQEVIFSDSEASLGSSDENSQSRNSSEYEGIRNHIISDSESNSLEDRRERSSDSKEKIGFV